MSAVLGASSNSRRASRRTARERRVGRTSDPPMGKIRAASSLVVHMDSEHSQHCQGIERALRRARRVRVSRASKQRRLTAQRPMRSPAKVLN